MSRMSHADYLAYLARRNKQVKHTPCGPGVARESELHRQILDTCSRLSLIAIHARMDRPSTIGVGLPDFVILCDGGRVLLLECKRKDGKLSIPQAALAAWARKLGHEIHVIRSHEEFLKLL